MLRPAASLYKRVLPLSCIPFSSPKGKVLFKEALASRTLESYFPLAEQFRTQDDPAFCGLSTLTMILNALELDPFRTWKGVWRFYHEEMLSCCVDLGHVKREGITFDQFACLAKCNGCSVIRCQPLTNLSDSEREQGISNFRSLLRSCSEQPIQTGLLVLSYSRSVIGQTGDGHFSPVGGYHEESDRVLIMDVARFKYPPHWVDVPTLFDAIRAVDTTTNRPRGILLMHRPDLLHPAFQRLNGTASLCELASAAATCLDDSGANLTASKASNSSNSSSNPGDLYSSSINPSWLGRQPSPATEFHPLALFRVEFPPPATVQWMFEALGKTLKEEAENMNQYYTLHGKPHAHDHACGKEHASPCKNELKDAFLIFIKAVISTPAILPLITTAAAMELLALAQHNGLDSLLREQVFANTLANSQSKNGKDSTAHASGIGNGNSGGLGVVTGDERWLVGPSDDALQVRELLDRLAFLLRTSPFTPVRLRCESGSVLAEKVLPEESANSDATRALECLSSLSAQPFYDSLREAADMSDLQAWWSGLLCAANFEFVPPASMNILNTRLSITSIFSQHSPITYQLGAAPINTLMIFFLSLPPYLLNAIDPTLNLSRSFSNGDFTPGSLTSNNVMPPNSIPSHKHNHAHDHEHDYSNAATSAGGPVSCFPPPISPAAPSLVSSFDKQESSKSSVLSNMCASCPTPCSATSAPISVLNSPIAQEIRLLRGIFEELDAFCEAASSHKEHCDGSQPCDQQHYHFETKTTFTEENKAINNNLKFNFQSNYGAAETRCEHCGASSPTPCLPTGKSKESDWQNLGLCTRSK